MSLHNMTVQPPVHHHAAFQIHERARFQKSQVGTFQGFAHSRCSECISIFTDHGQANAIVGHTLVYFQFIDKRTFHRDMNIVLIMLDRHDLSCFFYNS